MTDRICNAIAIGMKKALRDHYGWARNSQYYEGKRSPWYAPEYMLTVYIAREIRKLKNPPYVDIEDYVYGTICDAGGMGGGRIAEDMRVDGKFDISLSDKDHKPFAVIEVKFAYGFSQVLDDLVRVFRTLNRNSNIRYGILALFVPGQSEFSKGLLDSRIKKLKEDINSHPNFGNRKRGVKCFAKCFEPEEDRREYAALVFKFSNC